MSLGSWSWDARYEQEAHRSAAGGCRGGGSRESPQDFGWRSLIVPPSAHHRVGPLGRLFRLLGVRLAKLGADGALRVGGLDLLAPGLARRRALAALLAGARTDGLVHS